MTKIKELYIKYKEIINYLIIGGLTTVISLGTYYLLVCTILDPNNALELQIANVSSWIAAVIFAYFTNRIFVFESKDNNKFKEFFKFIAARLVTLGLDMLFMYIFVTVLGFNDKIIKIIVQILVVILNYIFSKFMVFKKERDNNEI